MKQLSDEKEIIGKTVRAMRSIENHCVIEFNDETFAHFEITAYNDNTADLNFSAVPISKRLLTREEAVFFGLKPRGDLDDQDKKEREERWRIWKASMAKK